MTAESSLVEFITTTSPGDVPAEPREVVQRMLLSTLATGIAGAGEEGAPRLQAATQGQAPVIK